MTSISITFSKNVHFRNIIASMNEISHQVNFEFNNDGLYIQGNDNGNIALMDLNLDKTYFDTFEMSNDDDEAVIVIGVDIEALNAILKCADPSDQVSLSTNENADKLLIIIQNDSNKHEFEMNLIEIDRENMDIPDIEHDFIIKCEPKTLNKYVQYMSTLNSGDICFHLNKQIVHMEGISDKVKMKFELIGDNDDMSDDEIFKMTKHSNKEFKNSYSIPYFQKFMKATGISKKVAICLTEDMPLFIQYQFDDGNLNYYLAPRIDDD